MVRGVDLIPGMTSGELAFLAFSTTTFVRFQVTGIENDVPAASWPEGRELLETWKVESSTVKPVNVTGMVVVQLTELHADDPMGTLPKSTEVQFKGRLTGAPRQ
jgi:hypothetical protein